MLKRKNSESDEANVKRAAVEIHHEDEGSNDANDSYSSPKQDVTSPNAPDSNVSEANADDNSNSTAPPANEANSTTKPNIVSSHKLNVEFDPATYIHLRLLVSLKEAVVIIGKGGSTIAKIRGDSGIKLNVSDHVPGCFERVVNLKGSAEHVSKAAGIIVRCLNNEQFDTPSAPNSKHYTLKVLMPHKMMGAMIGKGGSRFREIEEASAAKLKAREEILPNSTDRILQLEGVADAIHIAVYYVCTTYITHKEYLGNQKPVFFNPAFAMNPGNPGFYPMPSGRYNSYQPASYGPNPRGPHGYYNQPPMQSPQPYNSGSMRYPQRVGPNMSYTNIMPNMGTGMMGRPYQNVSSTPISDPKLRSSQQFAQSAERGKPLKQDISIPNNYVGSVIGKGGHKISQLRHTSGSNIKINEPIPDSSERTITLTGLPEYNAYAISLINNVIENEKRKNRQNHQNNNNNNGDNTDTHSQTNDQSSTDNVNDNQGVQSAIGNSDNDIDE